MTIFRYNKGAKRGSIMIYAMSDIHGCMDELETNMRYISLDGGDQVIFLGDYLDYGWKSRQVLEYIYGLSRKYDEKHLVVLRGNHEAMFLDWIHSYEKPPRDEADTRIFNDWLRTEFESGAKTIRSFLSEEAFASIETFARDASFDQINHEVIRLIMEEHRDAIGWIATLPKYCETDTQIFVHAGVDEEAGEGWKWGASDSTFLWTFQAAKGHFYKDVIAGHLGTCEPQLSGDRSFHDIFHDGESHFYIDGSVYRKGGKLNLLAFDETNGAYYSVQTDGSRIRLR